MKKLKIEQDLIRLKKAEARICDLKATLYYTQLGLPRQKQLNAHTEENLFNQAFFFHAENYPQVNLERIQYSGKNIEWDDRTELFAHYCFGKGRISFDDFRKVIIDPEKATA